MLQSIRNNAQGIFIWVIVGLIIISFALFGLGSYLSGASKVDAASVNGVDISETQVTRAYQNYQERLMQMFGDQYRPEMFSEAKLKSEVLQGLITDEVLNQEIYAQKYIVSPNQIFERLQKYKAFQENGAFSKQRYKQVLAAQGMNGEAFERDLAHEIATQQIRNAIAQSAFLTLAEQKSVAMLQNQKRDIAYFEVSAKPYLKTIKVSDEEIKSFYDKNNNLFLTPEKVQLEYLELNMDEVAKRQDVTDKMIKQRYESAAASYMTNDDAAAEKKAASILKQIKDGADFSSLAKKYSSDTGSAKKGGDLGYLTRGINEQFDKVVFSLKKGEVSKVLKTKSGFQIIKLVDIRKGDPEERKVQHILIKPGKKLKPLSTVTADIKKEIQYELAGKVFFNDADKLNNLIYETPDSLAPAADALGMQVKTSGFITRNGGSGIFANSKVINAAFSQEVLTDGHNSEMLDLSDTHLLVIRVKHHQPASIQPLDKIKTQIKSTLEQQKAAKKADEVTAAILSSLKNKTDIQSIQNKYPEIKWHKIGLIKRTATTKSDLPKAVREHAFAMPKPMANQASWDRVALSAGTQAIISVYKVENDPAATLNTKRIEQVLGNADYNSFVSFLKAQADIKVHKQDETEQ